MCDSFFDLTPGKFRPTPISSSSSITPTLTSKISTPTHTHNTASGGKSQRVSTPTKRLKGGSLVRGTTPILGLSQSTGTSRNPKRSGGDDVNVESGDEDLVIVTPSKSGYRGDREGGGNGNRTKGKVCPEVVDVDALFEDDVAMNREVAATRDGGMVGSAETERETAKELEIEGDIEAEREGEREREIEEGVRCPLCAVMYPTVEIEGHAATCNGPSSLVDTSPPPTSLHNENRTSRSNTTTTTTNDAKAKRKQTMAQLLQHRKRREKKRRRAFKIGGDGGNGGDSGSSSDGGSVSGGESLSETEDATAWVDPDRIGGTSTVVKCAPTGPTTPQPQPLTHGRTRDIRTLIHEQQPPQPRQMEACCPICARMFPVSEIQQHVDEELSGSMAFDSDIEQELSGDVPLPEHERRWNVEDGVFPDDDWFEVNDRPPSPTSRHEVIETPTNRNPPISTHQPASALGRSDTADVLDGGHHFIPETDHDDDLMMMLNADSPPSPEYLFSNNPKPFTRHPNPKPTSAEELAAQLFPEDTPTTHGDEPYSVPDPWPIFSQDDVFDYTNTNNNNNTTTTANDKTPSANDNDASDADDQQMSPLQGFDNLNDHKGDPDYEMFWKQFGAGGDIGGPSRPTYQNLDDEDDDNNNGGSRGWTGPQRKTKSLSSSSRGSGTGTRRSWKPRGRGRGRGRSYAGRSMGFKRHVPWSGSSNSHGTPDDRSSPAPPPTVQRSVPRQRNYYRDEPGFDEMDVGYTWEGLYGVTF
ncbi:hypothetical protein BC832DRAFT_356150 [Gaertneriomyces semiglobifer]|nr:hypothetical protein BC832DRAFT_356150 [Gaertneriomyces semiglobifer]